MVYNGKNDAFAITANFACKKHHILEIHKMHTFWQHLKEAGAACVVQEQSYMKPDREDLNKEMVERRKDREKRRVED